MKKIFFWFCVLCVVGVFLYCLLRPAPPGPEQRYYADFLPEDTVAVLSLYDMKGLSETFPKTSLGRFFSQPVMHEMMGELGVTAGDVEGYDTFYNAVADVMASPVFRQVFGDDAVIALCPMDQERLKEHPEQELKDALIVFGTSSSAGPISRFARFIMRKDVTNTEVAGLDMTRIRLDENEEIFGYDDEGVIVLAYNPERVADAVLRKKNGDNLRHTSLFAGVEAFWNEQNAGRVYAHSYMNRSLAHEFFSTVGLKEQQGRADDWAGVGSIGGLVVEMQGELRMRMHGVRDPGLLSDEDLAREKVLVDENISSSLLREGTLLNYRTSFFDKEFFCKFLFPAKREQQYSEIEKSVHDKVGFSLDKFLDAVGPQAEISVHGIVNAGIFPLPQTVLTLQVRNKKAAGWALRRLRDTLKEQGFANEHHESVRGTRLYYWTVLPVEATHLAIVLTDTMLYIANGERQLRTLLEEEQDPDALKKNMVNALGKRVGDCIVSSSSSRFLLRPQQIADQVAPAADWLTDIMQVNGTGPGKVQKELLSLMGSFDLIAACSNITETQVTGEVVFRAASKRSPGKE